MSTPKSPKTPRSERNDFGDWADHWIELEYGPPSLESISTRIAAFRANPNNRHARVTAAQLGRVLRGHAPAEWPPDIIAYLLDLLEMKLPATKGRQPATPSEDEAFGFMREQYNELQAELASLRESGDLETWRTEKGYAPRTSISDMAIEEVRRRYVPNISARALRNRFSRL